MQLAKNIHSLPNFSIGLVNYKTPELTKICLSLLKQHFDNGLLDAKHVQVWVVDNNSQDASTDYLRSLDWIHLIERIPEGKEEGFAAHGKALNMILSQMEDDYLFLMHTDTFVYEPKIFDDFLQECSEQILAVGCLEQLNRGYLRTTWRLSSRFLKHYIRRAKRSVGLDGREPKPWREQYIKSFFALWNVKWMKQQGYTFFMESRIPTYELQDVLQSQGKDKHIRLISPMKLFKFLDHVEAGTVGLVAGYGDMNRRVKRKMAILKKLNQS
ncbi:MAG: glycosyltransferase [Methylotenera sp.]